MAQRVATETLFYNADKSKLVPEGDAAAAYLFVREGSPIDEAEALRLGYTGNLAEVAEYNARADHAAKHGGDTQAAADAKRAAMFAGVSDPDGPPVEGERSGDSLEAGAKAARTRATKAVDQAPENK